MLVFRIAVPPAVASAHSVAASAHNVASSTRGNPIRYGPALEPCFNDEEIAVLGMAFIDVGIRYRSLLARLVVSGLITTDEDDPDREDESQPTEALASAAQPPTRLQQAAAGMEEAQAWKGQQIAKGWRKLVNALRRHNEGNGPSGPRTIRR
jgi:hypothetical protein